MYDGYQSLQLKVLSSSTTDSANIVLTNTTWLMETPVQILQQRLSLNLVYGKLFSLESEM